MSYKLTISNKTLQEYLHKLPIGYYLGYKLEVSTSDNENTYFDLLNKKIYISRCLLNDIEYDEEPTQEQIENDVRCALYHELSHAILTPRVDIPYDFNIYNAFEDERCETLLGNYYKRVDFKSFVKRINKYDPNKPYENPFELFYRLVRFRELPFNNENLDWLLRKVNEIIDYARYFNSIKTTHFVNKASGGLKEWFEYSTYVSKILSLYHSCENLFERHKDEQKQMSKENEKEKENEEDKMIIVPSPLNEDEEDEEDEEENDSFEEDEEEEDDEEIINDYEEDEKFGVSEEELEEKVESFKEKNPYDRYKDTWEIQNKIPRVEGTCFENGECIIDNFRKALAIKSSGDKSFRSKIKKIIDRYNASEKKNGHSTNAYSGRLESRLTINEDFKWFIKKGGDKYKNGSKLKLNIFCDTSGSFRVNEIILNDMLFELEKLEKEYHRIFEFDLISMDSRISIMPKNNRRINCIAGGTFMRPSWKKTFDKVQNPSYDNINIVLFDGRAYNNKEDREHFKMFDKENVILIAESSNAPAINLYCKHCRKKVIVDTNGHYDSNGNWEYQSYPNLLQENILKVLNACIR